MNRADDELRGEMNRLLVPLVGIHANEVSTALVSFVREKQAEGWDMGFSNGWYRAFDRYVVAAQKVRDAEWRNVPNPYRQREESS